MVALTALALHGAITARAEAHVEAAIDENNRYLKLTPMGDRVRLAYTVFLGQVPGQALRRRLDRDRDGQVSDTEAAVYGDELGRHIRAAVAITLDGRPATIAWSTQDVGLGTPSVTGGSFSVDLVGWICTGGAGHQLRLVDTVTLDKPGETELRLEDGPGVHFRAGEVLERKWTGGSGPLTEGVDVAWTVDGAAPRSADGRCGARTPDALRWWPKGILMMLVTLFIALGATYGAGATRRKRQRKA